MIDKDWRPENWTAIKMKLEETPFVWGTAMRYRTHAEQVIEATASRILEEFLKLAEPARLRQIETNLTMEEKENGQTYEVRDIWQTGEPKEPV